MNRSRLALVCLLVTPAIVRAQPAADRPKTLEFLQSLLTTGGGYLDRTPPPNVRMQPTLRSTSAAVRALKYNGGEPRHTDATIRFLASCFDAKSGGFADTPGGEPTVGTTAVGMMAVVELRMPAEPYRERAIRFVNERAKSLEEIRIAAAMFESLSQRSAKADEWLAEIAKTQRPDGTFGDSRKTAATAAMILRLGGKLANRDAVLRVMKEGQRPDGGFGTAEKPDGSDLESTYRVMRAFAMLKEKPANPDKLKGSIARCRNADGGYGLTLGQPSTTSGTYYAAIVSHWLSQP